MPPMSFMQRRMLTGAGAGAAAGLFGAAHTDDGSPQKSGFGHYARYVMGGAGLGAGAGAASGALAQRSMQRTMQSPVAQRTVNTAATSGFNFKQAPTSGGAASRGAQYTRRPAVSADRAVANVAQQAPAAAAPVQAAARQPAAQRIVAPPSGPVNVRQGATYANTGQGAGSRAWTARRAATGPLTGGGIAQNGLTPVRGARPAAPGRTPNAVMGALDEMAGTPRPGFVGPARPVGGGSLNVNQPAPGTGRRPAWGGVKMSSHRRGKFAALSAFMSPMRMRYVQRGGVEALPEIGQHFSRLIERAGDMPPVRQKVQKTFSAVDAMAQKARELRVPNINDRMPIRDIHEVLQKMRGVAA